MTGDKIGENPRFKLEVRCSIQLSYQGVWKGLGI